MSLKRKVRLGSIVGIFFLMWGSSFAQANISLLGFQANGLAVTQSSGGQTFTGQLSWTPEVGIGFLSVRGSVGAALMKSVLNEKFLATHYQGFLKLSFLGLAALEGGGGLETWVGNGGTYPIVSGNFAVEFPGLIFGINRVFAGYSHLFVTNNSTNQFKLGIGFDL